MTYSTTQNHCPAERVHDRSETAMRLVEISTLRGGGYTLRPVPPSPGCSPQTVTIVYEGSQLC